MQKGEPIAWLLYAMAGEIKSIVSVAATGHHQLLLQLNSPLKFNLKVVPGN